jgi:hypothetical protein
VQLEEEGDHDAEIAAAPHGPEEIRMFVGAPRDRGRPAIDHCVLHRSRSVIVLVGRQYQPASKARPELVERCQLGGHSYFLGHAVAACSNVEFSFKVILLSRF